MLDMKLVEAFVLLMRSGSLTHAEAVSGVSKATLSRQISRIETELGAELFMRSTRRITPTEAGRAFYVHCESLLDEVKARLETAQTEIHDRSEGITGSLSVLADSHFSTSFVCHVVRLFLDRYPNIDYRIDVAGADADPRMERVDCYVCAKPPDHPNLVGKQLGRLSHSLYASPHYIESQGLPATPQELAHHKAVVLSAQGRDAEYHLHSHADSCRLRPDVMVATNDYWIMKSLCIEGFGIALLPDFFTRPEIDNGALRLLLPGWQPEPTRIYCAFQKQRYMGRKLRAFVDLMEECFERMDSFNHYVGSDLKAIGRAGHLRR